MTDVKIIGMTHPSIMVENRTLTPEEFIAYTARVSNPGNQSNTLTTPKLLRYLLKHKHFSPFEMVHVVMEVNTTRDIAHQIIRHRSFAFQEFSQRYADPTQDMGITISEARLQDHKNRQNSIDVENEDLHRSWVAKQQQIAHECQLAYKWAVENGIAKELARKVLPEGLTNTRLYMAGSLRSYIHYVDVRAPEGTQKEHRIIADLAQKELLNQFPSLREYWFPEQTAEEMINEEIVRRWWKFWS